MTLQRYLYPNLQEFLIWETLTKFRIFSWNTYLGKCGWAQCNHKGPFKREADHQAEKI